MKATAQFRMAPVIPALLLAVHAGREDEVRSLLDAGADVNSADGDGITPLMATAMNGNVLLARLLLAAVIDDENEHALGRTAKVFRKESVS